MYWGVKPAHKGKKIGRFSQKIADKYFVFGLDLFWLKPDLFDDLSNEFVYEIII